MTRRRWPIAIIALLLALGYWFRAPLGTWYVARQVGAVGTEQEQKAALCRMNDWARSGHALGYSLEAFDGEGEQIHPTRDGRYEDIAILVITWTNGARASIRLLGQAGLDCAYHG